MATRKNSKVNEGFEQEYGIIESWSVDHVREISTGTIYFNLTLNGVKINSCYVKEWKDGKETKTFIGMPSYKGSDGKYYNNVYFRFLPEDQDAIIQCVYDELDAQK